MCTRVYDHILIELQCKIHFLFIQGHSKQYLKAIILVSYERTIIRGHNSKQGIDIMISNFSMEIDLCSFEIRKTYCQVISR